MLSLGGNRLTEVSPLAGLTNLTTLAIDWEVDLSPLSDLTSLTTVHRPPRPYRYPKLDNLLNDLVEAYEDALAAGRVTSTVVPGNCRDTAPNEFRTWDPSKPAPSVRVRIRTDTRSRDAVARFLEAHGIAARTYYGVLSVCVPVPLLVPLSEQPGVRRMEKVIPPVLHTPAVIEEESWGTIKNRFK